MIFLELSHHHPQFILIFSSWEQLLCFLCALHLGRTACITGTIENQILIASSVFALLPFVVQLALKIYTLKI